jgi:hypothetical protein
VCASCSQRRGVRGGGRSHLVPPGQAGLHQVLHVRGRAQAPHAVPGAARVQRQRERVRLARERGTLHAPHPGAPRRQEEIDDG